MPRTKGASEIPPRKRARILAKKNTNQYNRSEIALSEKVSLPTVDNITMDTVSPQVRKMADKYTRDFVTYADANAMKAQIRTFNTIDELTADKAAGVAEKNFNMAQISRNLPTQITNKLTDEDLARELLFRLVNNRGWTQEKAEAGIKMRFPDFDLKLLNESNND